MIQKKCNKVKGTISLALIATVLFSSISITILNSQGTILGIEAIPDFVGDDINAPRCSSPTNGPQPGKYLVDIEYTIDTWIFSSTQYLFSSGTLNLNCGDVQSQHSIPRTVGIGIYQHSGTLKLTDPSYNVDITLEGKWDYPYPIPWPSDYYYSTVNLGLYPPLQPTNYGEDFDYTSLYFPPLFQGIKCGIFTYPVAKVIGDHISIDKPTAEIGDMYEISFRVQNLAVWAPMITNVVLEKSLDEGDTWEQINLGNIILLPNIIPPSLWPLITYNDVVSTSDPDKQILYQVRLSNDQFEYLSFSEDILINPSKPLVENVRIDQYVISPVEILTITCDASHPEGILSVEAVIQSPDGTEIDTLTMINTGGFTYEATWDPAGAALGDYFIDIRAIDDSPSQNQEYVDNGAAFKLQLKTIISNLKVEGVKSSLLSFAFKGGWFTPNVVTVSFDIENRNDREITYDVSLDMIEGDHDWLAYDSSVREITLGPGESTHIEWELRVLNAAVMSGQDWFKRIMGELLSIFLKIAELKELEILWDAVKFIDTCIELTGHGFIMHKHFNFEIFVDARENEDLMYYVKQDYDEDLLDMQFTATRRQLAHVQVALGLEIAGTIATLAAPALALIPLVGPALSFAAYAFQAMMILTAYVLYITACTLDPPQDDYDEIFIPEYVEIDTTPADDSAFSLAVSSFMEAAVKFEGDIEAIEETVNRKNTALNLGDEEIALMQSDALLEYIDDVQADLSLLEESNANVLYELEQLNETYDLLSEENLQQGQDVLKEQGLPEEEIELLQAFGFDSQQIEHIYEEMIEIDVSEPVDPEQLLVEHVESMSDLSEIYSELESVALEENIELDVIVNEVEVIEATEDDQQLIADYIQMIEDAEQNEEFGLMISYCDDLIALINHVLDYTNNVEYIEILNYVVDKKGVAELAHAFDAVLISDPLTIKKGEEGTGEFLLINKGNVDDSFEIELEGLPGTWEVVCPNIVTVAAGSSEKITAHIIPPMLVPFGVYDYTIKITSTTSSDFQIIETSVIITGETLAELFTRIEHQIEELKEYFDENLSGLLSWSYGKKLSLVQEFLEDARELIDDGKTSRSLIKEAIAKILVQITEFKTEILTWLNIISDEDAEIIVDSLHDIRNDIVILMGASAGTEQAYNIALIEVELLNLADVIDEELFWWTGTCLEHLILTAAGQLETAIFKISLGFDPTYTLSCAQCKLDLAMSKVDYFLEKGKISQDLADVMLLEIEQAKENIELVKNSI